MGGRRARRAGGAGFGEGAHRCRGSVRMMRAERDSLAMELAGAFRRSWCERRGRGWRPGVKGAYGVRGPSEVSWCAFAVD